MKTEFSELLGKNLSNLVQDSFCGDPLLSWSCPSLQLTEIPKIVTVKKTGWSSLICVSSSKCVYMCVTVWVHFGSILGPFWVHFGFIMGPFWVHFGSILGPFWVHFGSILGPFWVHIGSNLFLDKNQYLDKNQQQDKNQQLNKNTL